MQKVLFAVALSALAAASFANVAAADDRRATSAERANIGAILSANGYTSWKKIEFDREDGKFEIDNARHVNGGVYDIDIRGGSIVKRERE
jgi:opacity protein-like surface antigen